MGFPDKRRSKIVFEDVLTYGGGNEKCKKQVGGDWRGRRGGGLKGGKARADKLSKEQLSEIGKKAAKARWSRKSS